MLSKLSKMFSNYEVKLWIWAHIFYCKAKWYSNARICISNWNLQNSSSIFSVFVSFRWVICMKIYFGLFIEMYKNMLHAKKISMGAAPQWVGCGRCRLWGCSCQLPWKKNSLGDHTFQQSLSAGLFLVGVPLGSESRITRNTMSERACMS